MKLIWDKASEVVRIGNVTLEASPCAYPPFTCEAIVQEQDTHLLLGEQHRLIEPKEPAWYLANTLERDEPVYSAGDVVIKPGTPARWLAVIHDIEQQPTTHNEIIQLAWQNILRLTTENNITRLATPALGSVHGKITVTDSLQILFDLLRDQAPAGLEKIWIIIAENQQLDLVSLLR